MLEGWPFVSQYTQCIVTKVARQLGTVPTTWRRHWALGERHGQAWGRWVQARGRADERARKRASAQAGRGGCWAHARGLCAPGCDARPTGCALGALSLF